jgi:hypothetical protein
MSEGFIITDEIIDNNPDGFGTGLIHRDFAQFPVGYSSGQFDIPLIPKSEQEERLRLQLANKSSLRDLRRTYLDGKPIPSTNQQQTNYCWSYSTTSAVMLANALQGQPHAQLSGAANAAMITNFRNVGGWGSASLERAVSHGIPDLAHWAEGNAGINRHFDSEQTWENAAKHRVLEFMECQPRNVEQMITCFLLNIPLILDFNHWRHSVGGLCLKSLNPLRITIWNSWGNEWADLGEGDLVGNKAIPDGMVAVRVKMAA